MADQCNVIDGMKEMLKDWSFESFFIKALEYSSKKGSVLFGVFDGIIDKCNLSKTKIFQVFAEENMKEIRTPLAHYTKK